MKYLLWIAAVISLSANLKAQTKSLPPHLYVTMRDSTTSADVVLMQGEGGSLSMDGKNVYFFNSFIENESAPKTSVPLWANVMWQIHGQEFLSGSFYLGDTSGYVLIKRGSEEYVNKLSEQGFNFFTRQIKR